MEQEHITVEKAEQLILSSIPSHQKVETISLLDAVGRILAEDIFSERDQPPFHRVAMDGIAISHSEYLNGKKSFKIYDCQKAGEPQKQLISNDWAIEVMTGSILPAGCDCVIRYEDLTIEGDTAVIKDNVEVQCFSNVHPKASDFSQGELVLRKGQKLNGPRMGICASQGKSKVSVFQTFRISIISTGNELVDFDKTPMIHQIRRSNPYALAGVLSGFGFKNWNLLCVRDDIHEIHNQLTRALDENDVLILTGGVSMGKFDFIPRVLSDLKVEKIFHKILQKPGKPFWFGKSEKNKLVFALPGNPVSCLINLRRYVIPALSNEYSKNHNRKMVYLSEEFKFQKPLTYFLPVQLKPKVDGGFLAYPIKTNGSGDYGSLSESDGFVELPFNQNKWVQYFGWED